MAADGFIKLLAGLIFKMFEKLMGMKSIRSFPLLEL